MIENISSKIDFHKELEVSGLALRKTTRKEKVVFDLAEKSC